ncbi:MAG: hypothetical protein P4K98_13925 [Bryobacteraceae bacterium]|nr:hypothetical protein [Bryobacteraceae bacterium]
MRLTVYDLAKVKQQQSNLFVKHLRPEETNLSLYNLFKPFGEIFSSRLAQDLAGRSKGYGFVQYDSPEVAQKVVGEMNGKEYFAKKLLVEPYHARPRPVGPAPFANLYVKGLPPSVTTKDGLDALFAPFGPRSSVALCQSTFQGRAGYFGFVCFKSPEDASKAATALNGKTVEGSALTVVRALSKEQREREKRLAMLEFRERSRRLTLYVKSVTGEPLTEAVVRDQLKSFGAIRHVSIQTRKAGEETVNLPIAFVSFEKEQDLQKVQFQRHNRVGFDGVQGRRQSAGDIAAGKKGGATGEAETVAGAQNGLRHGHANGPRWTHDA